VGEEPLFPDIIVQKYLSKPDGDDEEDDLIISA